MLSSRKTTHFSLSQASYGVGFLSSFRRSQWRHMNVGASETTSPTCLFNSFCTITTTKTSRIRITGLCEGNHRWTVDSPHNGPVIRRAITCHNTIVWSTFTQHMTEPESTSCSTKKRKNSASLALCEGNPPVTGGFPSQRASNANYLY